MPEGRSVRVLDIPVLGGGVGMRIELNDCKLAEGAAGGDGGDVRIGDGVISTENHRDCAGVENVVDGAFDCSMAGGAITWNDFGVTEVDDGERFERVDPKIHVVRLRVTTGVIAVAYLPGAESSPRTVGDEVVHRCAEDHDVGARELVRLEDERDLLK